jgi:hypothetical protein
MSALLHFLRLHWSLLHADSPSSTPKTMVLRATFPLNPCSKSTYENSQSPSVQNRAFTSLRRTTSRPRANRRSSHHSPRAARNCFKLHRLSSLALLKFPCVMTFTQRPSQLGEP